MFFSVNMLLIGVVIFVINFLIVWKKVLNFWYVVRCGGIFSISFGFIIDKVGNVYWLL